MAACFTCGNSENVTQYRSLEVQTLPVRDLGGERRVQALGRFRTDGLCRACAQTYLSGVFHPAKRTAKKGLPFLAILLVGVLALLFLRNEGHAFRLFGIAGVICGVIGSVSAVTAAVRERRAYAALSPDAQLSRASWACLAAALPKKDGDNDLTYIPITDRTLAMKNGDLMIEYDLLPAIAKKTHKLIHDQREEEP